LCWRARISIKLSFCGSIRALRSPTGAKSVSYRLTVSSSERTLTAEDVTRVRTRIIDGMRALATNCASDSRRKA